MEGTAMNINQLEQLKLDGIERVEAHASMVWLDEADAAVSVLCTIGLDFTTDDIWKLLEQSTARTHDPRAMGAVMRRAALEGRLLNTGMFRKSRRPDCHRRPLAVWRPAP